MMIARMIFFLSLFIFFSEAQASYNLTLNVGYGVASSQEMRDQSLGLSGVTQQVKFGVIPGSGRGKALSEFGVSFSNKKFSGATKHDDVDIEITAKMNVLEFYYTHYMQKLYFELGYSRSVITSDVEGNLSETQKVAVKNIYNLNDKGFNSDAFRLLVGYSLYRNGGFVVSTYASHSIHQSSSYKETLIGLEFKVLF